MQVTEAQRSTYYDCSVALLRFVEARAPTARRFGAEADALWRSFAGDLDLGDRLELLLRDADRQWSAAFGPRAVFALRAAHEREAFGASWTRLPKAQAASLWKQASAPFEASAADPEALLDHLTKAWALTPPPFEADKIGPSSRVAAAGCGALLALARSFRANPDLSWSNQVIIVADAPGVRQLAAAIPALLDHPDPTPLLTSEHASALDDGTKTALARLGASPTALVSPDASEAKRAAVEALTKAKP